MTCTVALAACCDPAAVMRPIMAEWCTTAYGHTAYDPRTGMTVYESTHALRLVDLGSSSLIFCPIRSQLKQPVCI